MAKLPFETEIKKQMERLFPLVYRPMDVRGDRFTKKKPADFFACGKSGRFVIVECKATRGARLAFSEIKDHQREALTAVESTPHGRSYLAVNFRDAKGPGRAWMIPWCVWICFEGGWHKKSVNRKEMPDLFATYELERITGSWRAHRPDGGGLQIWTERSDGQQTRMF